MNKKEGKIGDGRDEEAEKERQVERAKGARTER